MATAEDRSVRQYLSYRLDEEVFAIDVRKVQEVLDYMEITKVPRAPEYMRGIVNVRGSVVPVVDMRLKFGMTRTERTANTCIIVMEIHLEDELIVIGALADAVKEVIEMRPEQIEPPPKIGSRWNTQFIDGIGKHNDEFIIILDIDRIFSSEELLQMQSDDRTAGGMREETAAAAGDE